MIVSEGVLRDENIVECLRSGETVRRPAVRAAILVQESVLLLKTEPRVVVGVGLHDLGTLMTEVVLVGGAIGHPALSEDDDVG